MALSTLRSLPIEVFQKHIFKDFNLQERFNASFAVGKDLMDAFKKKETIIPIKEGDLVRCVKVFINIRQDKVLSSELFLYRVHKIGPKCVYFDNIAFKHAFLKQMSQNKFTGKKVVLMKPIRPIIVKTKMKHRFNNVRLCHMIRNVEVKHVKTNRNYATITKFLYYDEEVDSQMIRLAHESIARQKVANTNIQQAT